MIGFSSKCKPVNVRVPQGSILGQLLFTIHVNNLSYCITSCKISMYAGDTIVYYSSKSIQSIEAKFNEDLANVYKWFTGNFLSLNATKSKFMPICGHR